MLLSPVSSFFSKLILTNNDGHFECFSLKNENIRTYLESSCLVDDPRGMYLCYGTQAAGASACDSCRATGKGSAQRPREGVVRDPAH